MIKKIIALLAGLIIAALCGLLARTLFAQFANPELVFTMAFLLSVSLGQFAWLAIVTRFQLLEEKLWPSWEVSFILFGFAAVFATVIL